MLIKRFRERLNLALTTIVRERYILNDARRRRESREYAEVIMRAARSIELDFSNHQILMIYNNLDLKFQRDIVMSSLTTSMQDFLQQLNDKKDI